jgi:hypothetical protein
MVGFATPKGPWTEVTLEYPSDTFWRRRASGLMARFAQIFQTLLCIWALRHPTNNKLEFLQHRSSLCFNPQPRPLNAQPSFAALHVSPKIFFSFHRASRIARKRQNGPAPKTGYDEKYPAQHPKRIFLCCTEFEPREMVVALFGDRGRGWAEAESRLCGVILRLAAG